MTKPLPVPEQINSVKLACSVLYYKSHTFILSAQTNVLFKTDVSVKRAFLRNKEYHVWRKKGRLKRVLNSKNGILIFFSM